MTLAGNTPVAKRTRSAFPSLRVVGIGFALLGLFPWAGETAPLPVAMSLVLFGVGGLFLFHPRLGYGAVAPETETLCAFEAERGAEAQRSADSRPVPLPLDGVLAASMLELSPPPQVQRVMWGAFAVWLAFIGDVVILGWPLHQELKYIVPLSYALALLPLGVPLSIGVFLRNRRIRLTRFGSNLELTHSIFGHCYRTIRLTAVRSVDVLQGDSAGEYCVVQIESDAGRLARVIHPRQAHAASVWAAAFERPFEADNRASSLPDA